MSDENNKLVRQSHEIAPAENFARKIEERLRAEPVPQVEPERECTYAFRFEDDVITRCVRVDQHVEHQNGMVFWNKLCTSVSPDGEPCIYQQEHVGDHGNGRDSTWGQQEIAQVAATPLGDFNVLSELVQKSPAFQQMLAQRAARGAPIMQRSPLRRPRDFQIGFEPVKVAPGATETVTASVQSYFRAEKMMVSDDAFLIRDVFVGAKRQLQGPITAAAFSPNNLGSGIQWDTVQPGLNISIVAQNPTDVERTLNVVLFGKAVI